MLKRLSTIIVMSVMVLACFSSVQAVTMEMVTVGNPGNTGELSGTGAGGYGQDRICGAVDYMYNIGKYEVTAGQYTEFLNAVATTDTYELYNTSMWSSTSGCKIQRSGSSGSYSYSVAADYANRPVNYVSFWDAARFSNWMHNGQGNGDTETGSYINVGNPVTFARLPGATWVIPTEDEWYKAAYHKNDGATGNYFDYPTSSDSLPSNDLIDPDPGNNATFRVSDYTIGSPYWRTEFGAHENSDSPYGTFDQGGNLREWLETVYYGSYGPSSKYRVMRGGFFRSYGVTLRARGRSHGHPTAEVDYVGFRVSEVPEPVTTLSLDIKPGGCPNPLNTNTRGKGTLPVAILGTDSFDVSEIDPDSISIADVVLPQKTPSIEDESAPIEVGIECACQVGTDGINDLVIHFSRRAVILALGLDQMEPGTVVPIAVEGNLLDGTPFEATDCVELVGRED